MEHLVTYIYLNVLYLGVRVKVVMEERGTSRKRSSRKRANVWVGEKEGEGEREGCG